MFDQATASVIAERIATGEPLEAICRDLPEAPTSRTVRRWIESDPTLASDIAHARDIGYDVIAWRARDVARGVKDAGSTGDVVRDRLIVETDLKLLAKWDPKRYGDRIQADVDMTLRVTVEDPTLRATATLVHHALPKPDNAE